MYKSGIFLSVFLILAMVSIQAQPAQAQENHTISGTILDTGGRGIDGVTVTFFDGEVTETEVTSGGGFYSHTVYAGWSGTVTPSDPCYSFEPASADIGPVMGNIVQDFTGTRYTYTISGVVSDDSTFPNPIPGVVMILSTGGSTTTGPDGSYSLSVNCGWGGTVTPQKAGWVFAPPFIFYEWVDQNMTNQNFIGTQSSTNYIISGQITDWRSGLGMDGVTVNFFNGITLETETTSGGGYYQHTVPLYWTGTVTPEYYGCSFSPSFAAIGPVVANTVQDFVAYPDPAITVVKEANPDTARVGDMIVYTYRVTNTGNVPLVPVTAQDNRLGTITLGTTSLNPLQGTSGTLSTTVVLSDFPGPLTNTVTATGQPAYGGPIVSAHAEISVTLQNTPPEFTSTPETSVLAGTPYVYAITVTDDDDDPLVVTAPILPAWLTLSDVPPTGAQFDNPRGVMMDRAGNVSVANIANDRIRKIDESYWLFGTPGLGDVGQHPVTLRVTDGTAEVDQVFSITVTAADVTIHKTVSTQIAAPGQTISYALAFSNAGTYTATDVIITDIVPITLTNVSYSSSGATVTPIGSVSYTWQVVDDLAPLQGGVITITGVVSPAVTGVFSLTNRATITTTSPDSDPGNDAAEISNIVDAVTPRIILTSPADGATEVGLDTPVLIVFSKPINTSTFEYTVSPDPGGWSTAWSGGGILVTLNHNPFGRWQTYTFTVTAAEDPTGKPLGDAPYTWQFTTVLIRLYLPLTLRNYASPLTPWPTGR